MVTGFLLNVGTASMARCRVKKSPLPSWGHDKVVAADVGCEFGYFLFDGVDCHAGYDASAFDTEVGVVFTAFGYGGAGARGYPQVELFRLFVAQFVDERFGAVVEVDAHDIHFGGHLFAGRDVASVGVDEFAVFAEFTTDNRGEEYGVAPFSRVWLM